MPADTVRAEEQIKSRNLKTNFAKNGKRKVRSPHLTIREMSEKESVRNLPISFSILREGQKRVGLLKHNLTYLIPFVHSLTLLGAPHRPWVTFDVLNFAKNLLTK